VYTCCLSVATAAGDDDGVQGEPLRAHLAAPARRLRRRRRPWKLKPEPEAVSERDSPRSSETGTTSNHAGSGDRPTAAAAGALSSGRLRRDVDSLYRPRSRPRIARSGSASADMDQLRRLRATSINNRLPSTVANWHF